jgi:hypothetical protein
MLKKFLDVKSHQENFNAKSSQRVTQKLDVFISFPFDHNFEIDKLNPFFA